MKTQLILQALTDAIKIERSDLKNDDSINGYSVPIQILGVSTDLKDESLFNDLSIIFMDHLQLEQLRSFENRRTVIELAKSILTDWSTLIMEYQLDQAA